MEYTYIISTLNNEEVLLKDEHGAIYVLKTLHVGEYSYGKQVSLFVLHKDMTRTKIITIGYTCGKIDWRKENIEKKLLKEGCVLSERLITFGESFSAAIEYINNINKFIYETNNT